MCEKRFNKYNKFTESMYNNCSKCILKNCLTYKNWAFEDDCRNSKNWDILIVLRISYFD